MFRFRILLCVVMLNTQLLSAQENHLQGEFWRRQALQDVLESWTRYARDETHGAFHTTLGHDWTPEGDTMKYPGMIARHLFSYAAAYLLEGRDDHLDRARKIFTYLICNGWDPQYGGWYTSLHPNGEVAHDGKDLFMNTYAITGLAMYWLVTRDTAAEVYLRKSIEFIESNAWDREFGGGYVSSLFRDGRVNDSAKRFSPQLAPLSGYLLYLYSVTRDPDYLSMAERILDTVMEHMYDAASGWILEGFDRSWQPIEAENHWMNTGHNLEVAWMLLRLYQFNGREQYLCQALELSQRLVKLAFDGERGYWYHRLRVDNPEERTGDCPWWVQAYGNMHMLYLFRQTGDSSYFHFFSQGARFWNSHFIDHQYGGAFLSVDPEGNPVDPRKAVATKTSYHSVEHGMINFLYLDFWTNRKGLTLNYDLNIHRTTKWYPLPIEDTSYKVKDLHINGKPSGGFNGRHGYVRLKPRNANSIKITLIDPD